MSLLVGSAMSHITFEQYLLTEAIEPIHTEYGSNPPEFNNKHTVKLIGGNIWGTCFIFDNKLYMIQIDKNSGEIAFGVVNTIPRDTDEFNSMTFSDDKVLTRSALKVFNKIFYVLLEVLKHEDINLFFSAANKDLDNFYSKLVKNKFFNERLNTVGYDNMYLSNNKYILNKVKNK